MCDPRRARSFCPGFACREATLPPVDDKLELSSGLSTTSGGGCRLGSANRSRGRFLALESEPILLDLFPLYLHYQSL
jgi:hypothetical protein